MKIDEIKEKYTKRINAKIQKYKNIILDSFVEFYGEEYRTVIIERFNDISFLYYISDITIFYIVDNLKKGYNDKFKDVIFACPYILYLIENNLYRKDITKDNFYDLGINKIVGSSDDKILKDIELLKYCIAISLREKNEDPCEINLLINGDIKRIIAFPIFSIGDESFFHELNHAICSELIIKNNEKIIKCGLDYSNQPERYLTEIINDMTSLEIYNIFKSKCSENIFEDNIMKGVLLDVYNEYHYLIVDFYEQNKSKIKPFIIKDSNFQINEDELDVLSLVEMNKKYKK